jgi:hypothetical protein
VAPARKWLTHPTFDLTSVEGRVAKYEDVRLSGAHLIDQVERPIRLVPDDGVACRLNRHIELPLGRSERTVESRFIQTNSEVDVLGASGLAQD